MKRASRISVLLLALMIIFESFALAAGARLSGIRFHSGSKHDRVVFDLSKLPKYEANLSADGRELTLDLADVSVTGLARQHIHQEAAGLFLGVLLLSPPPSEGERHFDRVPFLVRPTRLDA